MLCRLVGTTCLLLQIVKLNLLKTAKICAASVSVPSRNIFPMKISTYTVPPYSADGLLYSFGHAEEEKTLLWLHVSLNHERDKRSGLTWLWGMFNDILIHRLLRFLGILFLWLRLRLRLWLWLRLWFWFWFWLWLWFWFRLRLWLWYWGRDDRKGGGEEGGSV